MCVRRLPGLFFGRRRESGARLMGDRGTRHYRRMKKVGRLATFASLLDISRMHADVRIVLHLSVKRG